MKALFTTLFLLSSIVLSANPLWLRYPSISPDGSMIVFSYQGDLFLVKTEGGNASQLTSHTAYDYMPVWSADSKSIAFASNRHGNFDVYLTDIKGTTPKRLTFHSANDIPNDFTTDGKTVIYTSTRLDNHKSVQFPYARLNEVYQVDIKGGREKQLLTIAAEKIKYNQGGNKIIFQNKKGYENEWRKHHQSSVARDIVTYDFTTDTYKQITNWNGEDRDPVFAGDEQFFFLSEKSGTFNIWQGQINGQAYQSQITNFKNHPVRFLSRSSAGTLCFTYDGEIYTYKNGSSQKVNVLINKDNTHSNTKLLKISKGISEFQVSPNNKEIAFVYRGDVYVTSIDYATTKRITQTAGQERSVSFSPDGKKNIMCR